MSKQYNHELGIITENIAATALIDAGYRILERNFSNKFGEIDLIADDAGIFVFVEVKAKTGIQYGLPEDMISKGKLQKIRRMASVYLNSADVPCRIDVVAIVLDFDKSVKRLTHYKNVY